MLILSPIRIKHLTWVRRGLLVTASCLMVSPLYAAAPSIEDIDKLLSAGQPDAAYQLAREQRNEREGEPDFDYVYGRAALKSGHLSEGVLALERVVETQPGNARARFELATGYYLIGDNVRARREFERVMAVTASQQDKHIIQSYLASIRQRELRYQTSANAYVQLGIGFDTNINNAPSGDLVYSHLPISIHLGPEGTYKRDGFSELALGGNVDYPITRRVGLYGALNGVLRNYNVHESFGNNLYTGQFGMKWSYRNYFVKASLLGQQYQIDHYSNRNMYGATIEALDGFTPQYTAGVALSYMKMTFPRQPLRDSKQITLGATLAKRWATSGAPSVFGGVFGGKESADAQSEQARSVADRKLYGLQAGGDYKISNSVGIKLTAIGQKSKYNAGFLGISSLPARNETFYSGELALSWLVNDAWKVSSGYTYSHNKSNIDMYNYSRNQYSINVRRDF